VRDAEVRLNTAAASIGHVTVAAVDRSTDRLRQRVERLRRGVDRSLERADARLVQAAAGVCRAPARLDPEVRHLDGLAARVRLLDPVNTMARGWSITRTATGDTVRDADQLVPGTELITTFARGSARSTVEETLP
jgi:exodeoxyribonuclease VII large subunit